MGSDPGIRGRRPAAAPLKNTGIAKYSKIMVKITKSGTIGFFSFFCLCLLFGCGTTSFPVETRTPAVPLAEEAAISPALAAETGQTTAGPTITAGQTADPPASDQGYVRDMTRFREARREAEKFAKSDSRQDYVSGAVFANFREINLGGIPRRVLYRGSHPALPGDARFPYAQQLAENARVATVLNLADTEDEIALRAENIPWYQNFINKNNIAALALPSDFTAPGFFAGLKTALSFMAARNPPYLIHGIDGRDRTGFTAALLEALMGASAEEITADYMTSYTNLYNIPVDGNSYRIIAYLAEDVLLKICDGKAPQRCDLQREAERLILKEIGLDRNELELLKLKLSGSRQEPRH
jgi:protein tyrosine/serine phosphatase